jgi:hypothetical protein
MKRTPRAWRLGLGAAALLLVIPLVTAATVSQATAHATAQENAAPTVNWALAGSATATTAESANPAPNANLGADLSFTPQELAAGATFSHGGDQGTPVTIMREAGAS